MTGLSERLQVTVWLTEAMAAGARQDRACAVLGLSARTVQRWQADERVGGDRRPGRRQVPPSKLSEGERINLLAVANSAEFGHLPPSQIVPRLADRGEYLACESTFYRVLRAENQLMHRRAERPGHPRAKPRALRATAPNRLYTWDITYLPTPIRGLYFYLYLFLDVFSRKIVGWQVYEEESSLLASEVMRDLCRREQIAPNQVVLHADNGGPMKGATMLATLQALGVMPSFSRPAVSNDNPYSESLFRTLKYRPAYPPRGGLGSSFASLSVARQWVSDFVQWYNHEHRHSAIGFVTPGQRHAGLDKTLLRNRTNVYEAAKRRCPQRWSGATRNWQPVEVVHLNPDQHDATTNCEREVNQGDKKAA